jgi:diketogulonate reductase-like aldo/keto reductase
MEEMPQICLGTVLHSENLEHMKSKFKEAIDHGYRHIDSAQIYNNMAIMPEVINYAIKTS